MSRISHAGLREQRSETDATGTLESPSEIPFHSSNLDHRDDSGDDEGLNNQLPEKKKGCPTDGPSRRLKCPFHQRQPEKSFQAACRSEGFVSFAKLKEHIKRVHTRPLCCARCWKAFISEDAYMLHLQEENICTKRSQPQDDLISLHSLRRLDFKKAPYVHAKNPEDKWGLMYTALFPNDQVIPSPYEPYHVLSKALKEDLKEALAEKFMSAYEPELRRIKDRIPIIIQNCASRFIGPEHDMLQRVPSETLEEPGREQVLIQEQELTQEQGFQDSPSRADLRELPEKFSIQNDELSQKLMREMEQKRKVEAAQEEEGAPKQASARTIVTQSDSGYASASYDRYGPQRIPVSAEDDSATIYTQESDADMPSITRYIHEFASLIYHSVDIITMNKAPSCLESLLETFAIRLAYDGSERACQSRVFIHRHRRAIVNAFKYMTSEMEEHLEIFPGVESINRREKVLNWFMEMDNDSVFNEDAVVKDIDEEISEEEEAEDLHQIDKYRVLIENSEAYHWLTAQLKCDILLSQQRLKSRCRIRDQVLNLFPIPKRVSRRDRFEKVEATFVLRWDPLEFLRTQYSEPPFSVFKTAITLTGSAEEAQATTCRQYVEQTWPYMADTLLRLMSGALRRGYGCSHEGLFHQNLPCGESWHGAVGYWLTSPTENSRDGTSLTMSLSIDWTTVIAIGFRESVAEVGEMLAWLGSALRSSQAQEHAAICQALANSHPTTHLDSSSKKRVTECVIDFQLTTVDSVEGNGRCWLKMFRNPVIAAGFPILSRTQRDTGLEVPLNMMARSIQAKYITAFDRSIFLKGFSTMLIPTHQANGTIFWHLLYNEDRRRISYRDFRVSVPQNCGLESLGYSEVERSRHVVGWSSAVKVHAGAVDGIYDVRHSGLKDSISAAVLEKVSLSVGKVANVGANFNIGVKDIPLHLRPEGTYRDQIRDAYSNYVIFYDTEDERAWLVNGATALLHAARASLEEFRSSSHDTSSVQALFASGSCFRPEDFLEASTPHTSTSALEVLLAEHNRELVVDRDKGPPRIETTKREDGTLETVTKWDEKIIRFQDLVEQKWHIFEQMLDHQCSRGASGVEVKLPTRQYLKGFDFVDVATRTQDLPQKVTALKACGRAWIDFAQSTRAITLFGKGFGDVFTPSDRSNQLCAHWSKVPKGSGYLAICVADLIAISNRRGDPGAQPMRLVNEICWHNPHKLFETCACKDAPSSKLPFGRRKICDRIQILLPVGTWLKKINPPKLCLASLRTSEGAVLFGQSRSSPLEWRCHGDPEEVEQEQDPMEMMESPRSDSGLGSSLTPSFESDSIRSSCLTSLPMTSRGKKRKAENEDLL